MNLRLLDPVEHIVEHRRKQVDGDDLGQRLDLAFRQRIMRIGLNSQDLIDRNRGEVEELRSEEHTSELQSLMSISNAVFCLKNKREHNDTKRTYDTQIT